MTDQTDSDDEPSNAFDDDLPDDVDKEHSSIGSAGAWLANLVPKPLIGIRGTLYKRMVIKGLENYHKTAGGDAIAINAKPGQRIGLTPVQYRPPEAVDEGEQPGWKAKGRDKVWHAASEGNSVNYLGRTPTILLEDDDHAEVGWLAPRIGEAIELDNYWPVFTDADINAVIDYQGPAGAGGQPARADGGANVSLELDSPGEWAQDNILDLGSGDGYSGMRISARKAREWRAETTDSEHMQMQEDRGYLRGLANGENGPGIFRLLLLCAAIILGVLFLVLVAPKLIGSGGGAGGVSPIQISTLAAALGGF
jgi:hypothetical protein